MSLVSNVDVTCCDLHNYSIIVAIRRTYTLLTKVWNGAVIAKAPSCMPTEIYNLGTGFP